MQTPKELRLQKIRRLNLLKLLDEQGDGTVMSLLKSKGLSPSFQSGISRYLTTGAKTSMPLGRVAARNLEKRLGLEEFALDKTDGIEWQLSEAAPEPPPVERAPRAEPVERVVARSSDRHLSPGAALAQAVRDVAGIVPAERRDIVASLVSMALSMPQATDAVATLLSEEIERHAKK